MRAARGLVHYASLAVGPYTRLGGSCWTAQHPRPCHVRARTGGKLRSSAVTHGHRERPPIWARSGDPLHETTFLAAGRGFESCRARWSEACVGLRRRGGEPKGSHSEQSGSHDASRKRASRAGRGLDLLGRHQELLRRCCQPRLQPVRDAHPQEGDGPGPRPRSGTSSGTCISRAIYGMSSA